AACARLRVAMPVGTQRVVALALFRVAENLVGFRDLLEARGGFLALGYVGMVLARQPPISGLDRLVVGRLGHAEDRVIVLVIHVLGGGGKVVSDYPLNVSVADGSGAAGRGP